MGGVEGIWHPPPPLVLNYSKDALCTAIEGTANATAPVRFTPQQMHSLMCLRALCVCQLATSLRPTCYR